MGDYLTDLKNEFEAGEGSFVIQIRPNLEWDKPSFSRLTSLMLTCCQQYSQHEKLDRWIAHGFWFIPIFVRDWTTHPDFPRVHAPEYYEQAYQRLNDLAWWFFFGESPYISNVGFEQM